MQQQSPLKAEIIEKILERLLLIPNKTCWNSWFHAIRLLKKLIHKLNALMRALQEREFLPQELEFLDEYVTVVEPLAVTLDYLQGDNASLGLVLPAIVKLQEHLQSQIDGGSLKVCGILAEFILWDLNDRVSELNLFDDKDYILGK